ncbi:MAG: hypothetical protein U5R46_16510 [Gammaproteobacteria bacterium]|nr:hypothetical protein [Gammaproteobacteria bacterium]
MVCPLKPWNRVLQGFSRILDSLIARDPGDDIAALIRRAVDDHPARDA